MACPDCENKEKECGCTKEALSINDVCNPIDCSTDECTESFPAQCILYTGDDIICNNTILVTAGDNLAQAVANVVAFFCTQDGVDADIVCGTDTVVTAETSINDALDQIVAYFCAEITAVQNAVLNDVQIGTACLANPTTGCDNCTTTITFLNAQGAQIDQIQFSYTQCGGITELCTVPISEGPNDNTNFIVCQSGNLNQINYAGVFGQIENDLDLPSTLAYGLFSQTANSTLIQGITNNGGSLFGTGVGSLTVPANQFVVGDAFKLDGFGHLTHPSPPTAASLKIDLLINGVIELSLSMDMPAITDLHWSMEINFAIRQIGVSGQVMSGIKFMHEEDASDKLSAHGFTQLSAVDTTVNNTLDVIATWTTPDDNREIYSEVMNLHKIY
jgi:hypothetical protein